MAFSAHAFWRAGFRPFFAFACLSGAILPAAWMLFYTGVAVPPAGPLLPVQWHAHEMLYGFGWAVMGGFLLTASKNWVGIRGYHGRSLVFLAAAWLLDRLCMLAAGHLPPLLFLLGNNLFLVACIAMLAWTLLRHRRNDSFRDNYFFLLVLPLFIVAKTLLLNPEYFRLGVDMTLALYRVAFLIMFERTLTQFMRNVFQVGILRHAGLDFGIKATAVALVGAGFLPAGAAAALDLLLVLLLGIRFAGWKPALAVRKLEIGIMYLGYLCLVLQLLVDASARLGFSPWLGSASVHLFGLGVIGVVVPAMIVRISKGHTGRKVQFESGDRSVLWIMILGLLARVAAPQLWPAAYLAWLAVAALCWFAAFAWLSWRSIPFLLQPRVDGRDG